MYVNDNEIRLGSVVVVAHYDNLDAFSCNRAFYLKQVTEHGVVQYVRLKSNNDTDKYKDIIQNHEMITDYNALEYPYVRDSYHKRGYNYFLLKVLPESEINKLEVGADIACNYLKSMDYNEYCNTIVYNQYTCDNFRNKVVIADVEYYNSPAKYYSYFVPQRVLSEAGTIKINSTVVIPANKYNSNHSIARVVKLRIIPRDKFNYNKSTSIIAISNDIHI